MSKSANYPRKPFKTAIEIAENVDKLGGKCSFDLLAQSIGVKVTGAYHDSINTAIKHGLISKSKDTLELTPLYTDIKLAYTDDEKNGYLKKSFLKASVYGDMLKRFDGKSIPIHILDKMLMKEFSVSESIAKSVGNNLLKGANLVGLIVNDKVTLGDIEIEQEPNSDDETNDDSKEQKKTSEKKAQTKKEETPRNETDSNKDEKNTGAQINIDGLGKNVNLNINISLTVPETTNEEVYNKFFEAMKKHLLS